MAEQPGMDEQLRQMGMPATAYGFKAIQFQGTLSSLTSRTESQTNAIGITTVVLHALLEQCASFPSGADHAIVSRPPQAGLAADRSQSIP
jgi:hypothetical protein